MDRMIVRINTRNLIPVKTAYRCLYYMRLKNTMMTENTHVITVQIQYASEQ